MPSIDNALGIVDEIQSYISTNSNLPTGDKEFFLQLIQELTTELESLNQGGDDDYDDDFTNERDEREEKRRDKKPSTIVQYISKMSDPRARDLK